MAEIFDWFSNMENTKPLALVIFFVTFLLIVLYVYGGKKRKQRLESYKYLPFDEDEGEQDDSEKGKHNG